MLIIGVGHYSRVGKDTFANYLVDELQERFPTIKVLKRSLAWKLKQICFELYEWAGMREPEFYETLEGAAARDIILPALGKTPVEIWVDFGTIAVRNNVYERTWLDYLFKTDHGCDVLIVPDIRFPNEIGAVDEEEGTSVKVVRPGYGPRNTVADRALVGCTSWHNVIGEEGSMESLKRWAGIYAEWIGKKVRGDDTPPPCRTNSEIAAALSVEVL